MFPSHYGSRSTIIIFTFCYSYTVRFHPTMVLAQRCKWRCCMLLIVVSIPLWFSLNVVINSTVPEEGSFPSHYGSRST